MALYTSLWKLELFHPPSNPSLLSRLTFAFTTTLATYLVSRCLKRPNPPSNTKDTSGSTSNNAEKVPDRIRRTLLMTTLYRRIFLLISIWQSILVIHPHADNPVALNIRPEYPLNRWLLTWNPLSILTLTIITLSAWVRVKAFGQLGNDFTFELQPPQRLYTDGMYAYVQHPSYTTGFLAVMIHLAWFGRLDGVLATALPGAILQRQTALYYFGLAVALSSSSWAVYGRIEDEEALLKATFGKQWVAWASKTARLVPGIF